MLGGDPNFFRGGSKGVGDPLIPGNQSSCIARGGGGGGGVVVKGGYYCKGLV